MLYSYRAVDQQGKSSSGRREAGSERELADALRREGYLLLEAESPDALTPSRSFFKGWPNPFRRVSIVEKMTFSRNLAVMIGAGLALARALEASAEQTSNPTFRRIILEVRDEIIKGRTLTEGLKPHEKVFGTLFINMVEAGEISGNLEEVLKILARQMRRDHELRSKVRGAMIYPAIVIAALFIIGGLMMVWVVPTLTQTFAELEINLPFTTQIVIQTSNFLMAYYWYMAGLLFIVAVAVARFLKTPSGKHFFDTIILRMPVFGPLTAKLNSARFSRTLSSLITSGLPITKSLEVTASVLGNVHFRQALLEAAQFIQRGQRLHEILSGHSDIFPPMVTQMIQVGEETGTTGRMLLRLAIFYESEVSNATKNLSSIIEPLLMIIIGAVVGFFAVSMVQPIYGGLGNL